MTLLLRVLEHFFLQVSSFFERKKWAFPLTLLLLCMGFFSLSFSSALDESVTIDEVAHIISGYATLRSGAITMNFEHPPLVKVIAALPLALLPLEYTPSTSALPSQWNEGVSFLFTSGNQADTILFWARGAVLFFNTLLLFCAGILLRRFISPLWTLGVVTMIAMEPTVLAHAHYVTTDIPVALMMLLVLLLLLGYLRERTLRSLGVLALGLAVALVVKFSAVALMVYVLAVLFVLYVYELWKKRLSFSTALGHLGSLIGAILLLVWGIYTCFSFATPTASLRGMLGSSLLPKEVKELQAPLLFSPFTKAIPAYLVGFDYAQHRTEQKGEVTGLQFLDGEYHINGKGWWYYFPLALWYKLSPVTILFFFMGCLGAMLSFRKKAQVDVLAVLVGGCLFGYLLIAMRSSLNIGVRHVSPVILLLPLWSLLLIKGWRSTIYKSILLVLVFAHILIALWSFPYYLSYFNVFAGGSEKGYLHLSDSNVDWGQNMKRLSTWAKEHHVEKLYVDYWGKTPLSYYAPKGLLEPWGVDMGRPKGYLAVFASWIPQSIWLHEKGFSDEDYRFLEKMTPYDHVGPSIFIYDLRSK